MKCFAHFISFSFFPFAEQIDSNSLNQQHSKRNGKDECIVWIESKFNKVWNFNKESHIKRNAPAPAHVQCKECCCCNSVISIIVPYAVRVRFCSCFVRYHRGQYFNGILFIITWNSIAHFVWAKWKQRNGKWFSHSHAGCWENCVSGIGPNGSASSIPHRIFPHKFLFCEKNYTSKAFHFYMRCACHCILSLEVGSVFMYYIFY